MLSRPLVTLMTRDHLTPAQKAVSGFTSGYFDDIGWGFGMSVRTRRTHLGPSPGVSYPWAASVGSYGWPGVYGTGWYNDLAEDMTTILIIQWAPAPSSLPILHDLWTAGYQAIDDRHRPCRRRQPRFADRRSRSSSSKLALIANRQ
jgi:CubicO group peptidase (beta-lactamase class C family)